MDSIDPTAKEEGELSEEGEIADSSPERTTRVSNIGVENVEHVKNVAHISPGTNNATHKNRSNNKKPRRKKRRMDPMHRVTLNGPQLPPVIPPLHGPRTRFENMVPFEFSQTPIPRLMEITPYHPGQPPPPPPLPCFPPPPPPPAPPPLYAPPLPLGKRNFFRRHNNKPTDWDRPQLPPSPPGEIDNDYIDLLLEYKQIQQQLEKIKKEEEQATQLVDQKNGASKDTRTGASQSENVDPNVSVQKEPNGKDDPSKINKLETIDKVEGSTKVGEKEGEEEELDVLQLRLAALASAAKKTPTREEDPDIVANKKPSQKVIKNERVGQPRRFSNSISSKVGPARRSSHTDTRKRSISKERNIHQRPRGKRRQTPNRSQTIKKRKTEEEKEKEKKYQLEKERKEEIDRRRSAAHRILGLDNHKEQVDLFLQLMGTATRSGSPTRVRSMSRPRRFSSQSPPRFMQTLSIDNQVGQPLLKDNYEQVEMDIDSDSGSPSIQIEGTEPPPVPAYDPTQPSMSANPQLPPLPPFDFGIKHLFPEGIDVQGLYRLAAIGLALTQAPPPPPPEMQDNESSNLPDGATDIPLGVDILEEADMDLDSPLHAQEEHNESMNSIEVEPIKEIPHTENDSLKQKQLREMVKQEDTSQPDKSLGRKQEPIKDRNKNNSNVSRVDEEAQLRAQLLRSLAQRRKKKTLEDMETASDSPQSTDSAVQAAPQPVRKQTTKVPQITMPRHSKVVIPLGQDSSSDEEEQVSNQKPVISLGFAENLDDFLKAARKQVDKRQKHHATSPPTPEAMKTLTKDKAMEYRILKEEIKRRGDTSARSSPIPETDNEITTLKSESSVSENPKMQTATKNNTKELSLGDVTITSSPKKTLSSPQKTSSSPKKTEQSVMLQKMRLIESQTAYTKLMLEKDEQQMKNVKVAIGKKKILLHSAMLRSQKLREQLFAAEKVVTAYKKQLGSLNQQAQSVQSRVDALRSKQQELEKASEKNVNKLSEKKSSSMMFTIKNDNTKPKLDISSKAQMKSKLSTGELALERNRLQQREKELAEKLRTLKEASMAKQPKNKKQKDSPKKLLNQSRVEKIITAEKMVFSSKTDDGQSVEITPKRRRSLVDLGTSMTPKLNSTGPKRAIFKTEKITEKDSGDSDGSLVIGDIKGENVPKEVKFPIIKDEEVLCKKEESSEICMPEGQQMLNLIRLQDESTKELPLIHTNECQRHSLDFVFCPVITELSILTADKVITSSREDDVEHPAGLDYESHLLHFRSYRFHPYFRNKSRMGLTSRSFSHKLDPRKILCKYDLVGKCNDDSCKGQHRADYIMSEEEMLQDLVSYFPELAGVIEETPTELYSTILTKYVSKFKEKKNKISHVDKCLLLMSQVNECAKHKPPHFVFCEPRKWKPAQKEKDAKTFPINDHEEFKSIQTAVPKKPVVNLDDIIQENDMRYWMLTNQEVMDMESAILEDPNNTQMWLKLAFKKLHDSQSQQETNLDKALHALARGLEANKDSHEIWYHYLNLYSRRTEPEDLLEMCQQAINYAPSYNIFWKFLTWSPSLSQKLEICQATIEYLCSSNCHESTIQRSHFLLEIMLLHASLCISAGKLKSGIQMFEKALRPSIKEPTEGSYLTIGDRCLAWLSYIYLIEFQAVPPSLYDPSDSKSGRLIRKEPFLFPWKRAKGTKTPTKKLVMIFKTALKSCADSGLSVAENNKICVPIYRNVVQLELANGSIFSAKDVCKRVLQDTPSETAFWLLFAKLELDCMDPVSAKECLMKGIESNPLTPELYHCAASLAMLQGESDAALVHLEQCAIDYFDVYINSEQCDPNLLYCALLSQPLPLSYAAPTLLSNIQPQHITSHQLYLWLNYCLLLDLQGFHDQAMEAYETALCTLTIDDAKIIWKAYLFHCYKRLTRGNPSPADVQRSHDLVRRCLLSMPSKFNIEHTTEMWLDYSFHNDVVDFYLQCVPKENKLSCLENLLRLMPENVHLALRCISEACSDENWVLAKGICASALFETPKCLTLHNMNIHLAANHGTDYELEKACRHATRCLPLNLSLWKHHLLLAITKGHKAKVRHILQQSSEKGLNLQDFLNTLLKKQEASK